MDTSGRGIGCYTLLPPETSERLGGSQLDTSLDHTPAGEDAMAFELLVGRLGAGGSTAGAVPDVSRACFCLTWALGRVDADLDT
jgi:hypothetical protein